MFEVREVGVGCKEEMRRTCGDESIHGEVTGGLFRRFSIYKL